MSSREALLSLGYEDKGAAVCSKCRERVVKLEKDGKEVFFNPANHPVEPGVLHHFSCGQKEEDHSLPPIPDQSLYMKQNGQ